MNRRSSFANAALTALLALPLSCGREAVSEAPLAPVPTPVPAPTAVPAPTPAPPVQAPAPVAASVKTIHVFVALCDNKNQGIVPVPEKLGRGDDPDGNLYWGAAYGVRTFLSKSAEWQRLSCERKAAGPVIERLILRHRRTGAILVADAYRGAEIKGAVTDFLEACAGRRAESLAVGDGPARTVVPAGGGARLLVYVGHNGLMDFALPEGAPAGPTDRPAAERQAVVLCCKSQAYFTKPLGRAGAKPLVLTTGFMAPEAYVLAAALEGWLSGEAAGDVARRAAAAYDRYQKCGATAARRLFAAGG